MTTCPVPAVKIGNKVISAWEFPIASQGTHTL
jgi:hypothetical protein